MATIKEVLGIGPSNSGNIRVRIEFTNRGDMHFYMKPDGSLHFPPKHDQQTLSDSYEGFREYEWVLKTWSKTNPEVKRGPLKGDLRSKAFKLCMALLDPTKVGLIVSKALREKGRKTQLGEVFGNTLKGVKKNIKKENSKPVAKKTEEKQIPVVEKKTTAAVVNINETSSEKKPNYGTSRIDKFNKKYGKQQAG